MGAILSTIQSPLLPLFPTYTSRIHTDIPTSPPSGLRNGPIYVALALWLNGPPCKWSGVEWVPFVFLFPLITSLPPPEEMQTAKYYNQRACVYMSPTQAYLQNYPHVQISLNFQCMFPGAMAWSFFGGVAISCVLQFYGCCIFSHNGQS